ncbi:ATP-binding protein [Aspergillus vadensis CBS 113365]|uniref:P-loop containing nucleoside triphosphate hydrolase protein n=1 Tax=Aspergillus vadensis (strain CBS 113365 / IMI 142717 / IBT 24658) TaxID=1448311 RepID=A0A319BBW9_ASPVC|nr:P-loop containing nucleoside triphosphate hydrolase protein [Aspergillus vadensis CBS 113365]PYH70187.1 P-loop containing nucleoside triphosphate hydrolase protein [Aspergillus vadensis CBS 113365]
MLEELESLRLENERLRAGSQPYPDIPAPLSYRPHVFYCIDDADFYLDEPRWEGGGEAPILYSRNPIRSTDYYIDQHPEIAFCFCKYYISQPPGDTSLLESSDGVFKQPLPVRQTLRLVAAAMIDAVEQFVSRVPGFFSFFPDFDAGKDIQEPYLFMFYSLPYVQEARSGLEPQAQGLFDLLYESIDASHGLEYASVTKHAAHGRTSSRLIQYLIQPGDVLVDLDGPRTQAYLAVGWAEPVNQVRRNYEEEILEYKSSGQNQTARKGVKRPIKRLQYHFRVPVTYLSFDGNFERTNAILSFDLGVGHESETVPIKSLRYIPLSHLPSDVRKTLERRGETFWSIRFRRYITYRMPTGENLDITEDRYYVDISTYRKLHPDTTINRSHLRADIGRREMSRDEPPQGLYLLLFPPTIVGYNMLHKTWSDLYVDYIYDIDWNKQAFQDLVVDEEIKELVQALVTRQIESQKSTDSISGKGNGLILLLHGAPGTGKTFTAEGVAEFAEKPLFRITCGDVGIEATNVEKYLRAAFHLAKLWDCVVLLDEADVFLEERDVRDLNRNAVVSVFLRALEYHDGILILTSNRVGTFDEAFKSRIQLSLHYENLTLGQRRKIWRNFMHRLRKVDAENVDIEDVLDHLDELGAEDINGREIRNAITIARQLAQFKEEKFCYSHLTRVLRVSGKFGKYLRDLRDGLTDDYIKHDTGVRHSYRAKRANSMS